MSAEPDAAGAERARPWWASHEHHGGDDETGSASAVVTGPAPECQVCPVCSLLRVLGDARPELIAHLSTAARELTLAARALLDSYAGPEPPPTGMQRIPVDD